MPAKVLTLTAIACALLATACGSVRTPEQSGGQNAVVGGSSGYSPYQTRDAALSCLKGAGVPAVAVGKDRIRLPQGGGIYFAADRGAAAALQARGAAEGSEVIGSALFDPGASDGNLAARVEACL